MITDSIKQDFKEKVEDVLLLIKQRVAIHRMPVRVEASVTSARAEIKLIPKHMMGEANAAKYMVWIDKTSGDIRWCHGGF